MVKELEILNEHAGGYNATQYYYLHDRLGSVRQMINQNGAIVAMYTYNPFGEDLATECTETTENNFKYTGQWYDSETGQYYLRARQYSPYLSRFTSYDPFAGEFQTPLSFHKYLYCQNSPVNGIDLDGRKVSWASRDMAGFPVGNHHFIEIMPDDQRAFSGRWTSQFFGELGRLLGFGDLMTDLGDGKKGFTLAAFSYEGRLRFQPNNSSDLAATREYNNGTSGEHWYDWDYVSHQVQAPRGMSDTMFIMTLLEQSLTYAAEEMAHPIKYNLGVEIFPPYNKAMNCATWVSSMFNAAGVDEATRNKAGEFYGFDWGEENLIDESYFKYY